MHLGVPRGPFPGVEECVRATAGPVRDEALQPLDERAQRGVLGLLGADAGGSGVHHRGDRVAEVVAGLSHVPGQQRRQNVKVP